MPIGQYGSALGEALGDGLGEKGDGEGGGVGLAAGGMGGRGDGGIPVHPWCRIDENRFIGYRDDGRAMPNQEAMLGRVPKSRAIVTSSIKGARIIEHNGDETANTTFRPTECPFRRRRGSDDPQSGKN